MTSAELMLLILLGAVLIIDVITGIRYKKLQKEISKYAKWIKEIINNIAEEEKKIDKEIENITNSVWNNKVVDDVTIIREKGKHGLQLCPYHDDVMEDYAQHQAAVVGNLNLIRKQKNKMMQDTVEKMAEEFMENDGGNE